MPLTIGNPIVEGETNFTTVSSLRNASNLEWTYKEFVTTPANSSMPPIIVVNRPDCDLEDVQITHECAL